MSQQQPDTFPSVTPGVRRWARNAFRAVYVRCIEPRSEDETTRRKEFIFNVLLVSSLALMLFACLILVADAITEGSVSASPVLLIGPIGVLIGLLRLSRRQFTDAVSYIFIFTFLGLGTFALWTYGYVLPEGLLAYTLVIVFAGILISVRAAWIMLALIAVALNFISYVQVNELTHPDMRDTFEPLRLANLIIYLVVFLVILVVSWLYNRDIESSLRRARRSEIALRKERNSLEVKVKLRTKELEQVQLEKLLQQHRFAEFGRLSATLLHELSNPLTALSLELEHLEGQEGYSRAITRARTSVGHMEEYVTAARRQLGNQVEVKAFDTAKEITKVVQFLRPNAQESHIEITTDLARRAIVHGDSVRFYQIVSNLVANAIDASAARGGSKKKIVSIISTKHDGKLFLRVHDKGIGIASNDIARIFEPFYSTKSSSHGTGIGLYITKNAVEEAFEGTVVATSTTKDGTTFTVELPLYAP